jgi:hypothetical protein
MREPARHEDPEPDTVTDPQALRVPSENLNMPEAPWGVEEDSPMDQGSETAAVNEARRGERRAGGPPEEPAERQGILPTAEPTRTGEAGPGTPPDPAPPHRSFPDVESPDRSPLDR